MKKYYVLGFLFSEDRRKVVLIRKNKPVWQAGYLNGVGGHIELKDDWPMMAMVREFFEETGVSVTSWKEYCKLTGDTFDVYVYKSFGDISKCHTTTEEEIEIHNVSDVMVKGGLSNLSWLIPMALEQDEIYGQIKYN